MDQATYDDLRYVQLLLGRDGQPADEAEVVKLLLEEVVKQLERRERRRAAKARRR